MAYDMPAEETMLPRLQRFGYRNVAYLAFVVALVPIGLALEATGPDSGGTMAAILIWALISGMFFLANAALVVIGLMHGRPILKPLIACALPLGILVGTIAAEDLMRGFGLV